MAKISKIENIRKYVRTIDSLFKKSERLKASYEDTVNQLNDMKQKFEDYLTEISGINDVDK